MKFVGGFTWKYINAKHVAIQVDDSTDYARLLVGQNGMPVWYVDRHPMRVFRWSPDFNPYFETPIAAVWCNLVGLPIHLFERSALFAIGGMLGTPIQIDHATATQTRLSFARICVEIDISKPPTEEFTIDMMGREVVQKVKWDKIPLYCRECCHVGHSSSTCYANGQREKPVKRNFHLPNHSTIPRNRNQQHQNPAAGDTDRGKSATQQSEQRGTTDQNTRDTSTSNERQARSNEGRKAHVNPSHAEGRKWDLDGDGFQKQGRRRGAKNHQTNSSDSGLPRTNSTGVIRKQKSGDDSRKSEVVIPQPIATHQANQVQRKEAYSGRLDEARTTFVKPSYYKLLEIGDFDMEDMEDEYEEEEDPPSPLRVGGNTSKTPESDPNKLISEETWLIEERGFLPQPI